MGERIIMIILIIWCVAFGIGFYLIYNKQKNPNLLFEIFYFCLLINRVVALIDGECYRLTYEWDAYIFQWIVNVIIIVFLMVVCGITLYKNKNKSKVQTAILLSGYSIFAWFMFWTICTYLN